MSQSCLLIGCSNGRTDNISQAPHYRESQEISSEDSGMHTSDNMAQTIINLNRSRNRRLRYLYSSNGGLIGFFNDGTVAGCPKCDLLQENIMVLYESKPHSHYDVGADFLLVDKETRMQFDEGQKYNHWIIIDYKWIGVD